MNYLGTHPLEGAVLVASSDVTSDTASITLTGIFESETMYFINIMDYRPKLDEAGIHYRWLDGSDNAISITNYHEGGAYGYSGGSGSTGAQYNADRSGYANLTSGTGNASDEAGHVEMWCVPNTTQEKMAYSSASYHTGDDEDYGSKFGSGHRLNTSATVAEGIEFVCDGNTGGHEIANVSIRVYKLGTKVNPLRSLKRRHTDNWVNSNYIGGAVKGQGWAKVAELTATAGDSVMDFENVFTSNYKRYVITGTDCRPATGNTHLYLQYIDASGLNSSSSHWTAWVGYSGGYAGTSFNDDETIPLVMGNIGTINDEAGHFISWLTPTSTNSPKFLNSRSLGQQSGGVKPMAHISGAVAYNTATVMTGIRWYWSSGNWEEGTIKIYGVND